MNKKPQVSYLLCVYNGESTLAATLDSLLSQKQVDLEIITVNDGSKDKSLTILKKYGIKDKRIKIINQPNLGLSAARNRGIKEARGEYIASAAQDDIYLPDKTADQIGFMEINKLDFSFTGAQIINNSGQLISHPDNKLFTQGLWDNPFVLLQYILFMPVCSSTFICKKACYDKIKWNPALLLFNDKNLFLKMFLDFRGGKLAKISLQRRYHFRWYENDFQKRFPKSYVYLEHRVSLVSALVYKFIPARLIPRIGNFLKIVKSLTVLENDPWNKNALKEISKIYLKVGMKYPSQRLNFISKKISLVS